MKLNRTIWDIRSFWYRYWFNRNLRQLVELVDFGLVSIRLRELNRELGFGGARHYAYDTDPAIKQYLRFIEDVLVLMKANYRLYMDPDFPYKTRDMRRLQARYIRKGITDLYTLYLTLIDPNK